MKEKGLTTENAYDDAPRKKCSSSIDMKKKKNIFSLDYTQWNSR